MRRFEITEQKLNDLLAFIGSMPMPYNQHSQIRQVIGQSLTEIVEPPKAADANPAH